jgi:hypothetical protein
MTEAEEREFIKTISAAIPTEWINEKQIFATIKPLIAKAKRDAWCAGRDAGARFVAPIHAKRIRSLEPPEDL